MELHAHLTQRQVGLGGQQQHEQPHEQREIAGEQAEADGHRDDRDRDRGQELQREPRQERHAQHRHRLALVVARDGLDGVGRAVLASEGLQRAEPLDGVGEARGEAAERAVLPLLHAAGGEADEHHEHRDEGDRQHDDEPRQRVGEGHGADEDRHGDRGGHQLRQVAAEVRVQRLETVPRGHGEAGGIAGAEPPRAEARHGRDEGVAQLQRGGRGAAGRHPLGGGDQRSAQHHECGRHSHETPHLAQRAPLDHPDERARERPGEAHDDPRLREHDRRGHGEEAPRRGRVPQQAGVDGFHGGGLSARRARPSRCGRGSRACGTPSRSTPGRPGSAAGKSVPPSS